MKLQLPFLVLIVPSVEFHLLPLWHRKLRIACGYRIPNIFDKKQLFGQLQALNFTSYFIRRGYLLRTTFPGTMGRGEEKQTHTQSGRGLSTRPG